LGRKPDFTRPQMHFRPGTGTRRKELPPATQRGQRTISRVIEAGLAGPAFEGGSSGPETRRWTAAHSAIERCHASRQPFVNLFELVDPLELIDGESESGQHANQEKREPHLQTPADGIRDHDLLGKPPPLPDSPSSPVSGLMQ